MVETDQKKIPSQKCFLHVYIGTMIQLFKKKKIPAHEYFCILNYCKITEFKELYDEKKK